MSAILLNVRHHGIKASAFITKRNKLHFSFSFFQGHGPAVLIRSVRDLCLIHRTAPVSAPQIIGGLPSPDSSNRPHPYRAKDKQPARQFFLSFFISPSISPLTVQNVSFCSSIKPKEDRTSAPHIRRTGAGAMVQDEVRFWKRIFPSPKRSVQHEY